MTPLKFEYCRFSRRIRGHMRKALDRELGPYKELMMKKTEGQKCCDTVPLNK
jgi:hypothetical protein